MYAQSRRYMRNTEGERSMKLRKETKTKQALPEQKKDQQPENKEKEDTNPKIINQPYLYILLSTTF